MSTGSKPIYLDHHAASPVCAVARSAMAEAEEAGWANPASIHAAGRAARALLERARDRVAAAIGAEPADLVLTSGGTEACNLGVLGLGLRSGAHLVTTAIEHPAVASAVASLERSGVRVTRLAVPAGYAPAPAELAASLTKETALCALQWVNHETGVVLPVAEYGRACSAAGVPLFVDATQAAGKLPIDVTALHADFVALASHKLGGPSGAGALWVRRTRALEGRLLGGKQERGRRAGSPDVLAAVGFGAACAALGERLAQRTRLGDLRDALERELLAMGGVANAAEVPRVATVTNVSFRERRGEALVAALDLEGVCAASGAACSSGLSEPSPVLLAMYPGEPWRAAAALRFSLGPESTQADVSGTVAALRRVLGRPVAGCGSRASGRFVRSR